MATETTTAHIKDAQTRIREIAAQYPERAAALTDASNYRIYTTRRTVCESGRRQSFYVVGFRWPEALAADLGTGVDVSWMDTQREARAVIDGRCAALA